MSHSRGSRFSRTGISGTFVVLAMFALQVAHCAPSVVSEGERAALREACARRATALSRMEDAVRAGQPRVYYRTMKAMVTEVDPFKEEAGRIRKRLVTEMAAIQVRNMRMGLGKDPASWPPPDPEAWAVRERTLKALPALLKADVVFVKNVGGRLEPAFILTMRDPESFGLNRANLERDIALLRSCLHLLRQKVDAL